MKYVGSKNRIAKELAPIIQSYITNETKGYLEPFVGGANMIDKIEHHNKIGCDIHKELIALLNKVKNDKNSIPDEITEDEYNKVNSNKQNYEDWYVGLVGFCATFGAKYFGGYARDRQGNRNIPKEGIRNLKKQAPSLKGVKFANLSFLELPKDKIKDYVIYCDIPYKGTIKYATKGFPYDEFYQWAKDMSENNTVLISEYNMPEEFYCIWEKETTVNIASNKTTGDNSNKRVEKLYTYNNRQKYSEY